MDEGKGNKLPVITEYYSRQVVSDSLPPLDSSPPGFSVHFSGKNTGVGCHALLQGIFLTQGSNPCPVCRTAPQLVRVRVRVRVRKHLFDLYV